MNDLIRPKSIIKFKESPFQTFAFECGGIFLIVTILVLVGGASIWEAVGLSIAFRFTYAIYSFVFQLAADGMNSSTAKVKPNNDGKMTPATSSQPPVWDPSQGGLFWL